MALAALIEASMDPRDALYENEESSRNSLGSMHPLKLKRENNKVYNNYLKKSYDRRNDRKMQARRDTVMAYRGVDPSDPTSYDFTLDHDLDEPEPAIPKGGERLWLADSADNKRQCPVLDENRLILKKLVQFLLRKLKCETALWSWTQIIWHSLVLLIKLLILASVCGVKYNKEL